MLAQPVTRQNYFWILKKIMKDQSDLKLRLHQKQLDALKNNALALDTKALYLSSYSHFKQIKPYSI